MATTPERNSRRSGFNLSIVAVLGLGFTSLTVLAVMGALVLGLLSASHSTNTLLRERAAQTLDRIVERLFARVNPVVVQAQGIAEEVAEGILAPENAAAWRQTMEGALATLPQLSSIMLIHLDCRVDIFERGGGISHSPRDGISCNDLEWGRTETGVRWLPPFWSPALAQTVVAVEQPLHDKNGYAGLMVSTVSLNELSHFLASLGGDSGQTPFILYGRDKVVAHSSEPALEEMLSADHPLSALEQVGDPLLPRLWDQAAVKLPIAQLPVGVIGFRVPIESGEVRVMYRTLDAGTDQNWIVGTHYEGNLGADETRRLQIAAIVGGVILVVAMIVTFLLGRRLSQPIRELAAAASVIETQDFEMFTPLGGSRVREFNRAAGAFNSMVAGLRDRQRMRDLFGRYVPEEVVAELLAGSQAVSLGGEKREVTLLFTDIVGFTSHSEHLPPEKLVGLLNEYFHAVAREVVAERGIVVDFIGDAMFAMFGAPVAQEDHAAAALACARAIQKVVAEFCAANDSDGRRFGETRIGVHTSVATVGNFGSTERLKYSAMGDAVNTAARLEGANKHFGTTALASGVTVSEAHDDLTRPVGQVVLKGKSAPLETHEILSEPLPYIEAYRAAYALMAAGDARALEAWRALAILAPQDSVVRLHLARVEAGEFSAEIHLTEK
jgi:adenylate cyclase